jgi:hypothetical protein
MPIVATQSISSPRSALGSDEAWRTLLQCFRTKVFLATSDEFTARIAAELCGRADRLKAHWSTSVGSTRSSMSFKVTWGLRGPSPRPHSSRPPVRAAHQFVHDYHAVVRQLTTQGLEPTIARTLAGIASVGAEPLTTAGTLVERFRDIEDVVKRRHPHVARSVALAACRATDPMGTARLYVANDDRIVAVIGKVDPQRARRVANQAFRSDNPIAWARRFHRKVTSANG